MYEMKDEYFTGIQSIDDEHKKLFEIADKVYELYHNDFIPDKYDYIFEVFTELKDYAVMHFEHEEAYMESINYKKIFTQKIQHKEFTEKVVEMFDKLDADHHQDGLIEETIKFLTDWLVDHILYNDKEIGK